MSSLFYALLGWLPFPLNIICSGVVFIFFLVTFLNLICFILDIIPFL